MTQYLFVLTILALTHVFGHCSILTLRNCVLECTKERCDTDVVIPKCSDCNYDCIMIEVFAERNWTVGQERPYGKWPLKRLLGLQEPASVAFSLLNLLTNRVMFHRYKAQIGFTLPSCKRWISYTWISTSCWIWSAIFHGRHTLFTEIMESINTCALILFTFYIIGFRILLCSNSTVKNTFKVMCSLAFVYYFLHLCDTGYGYKYNMTIKHFVGTLTALAVTILAISKRHIMVHYKYLIFYVVGMSLASIIEKADFPPLLWTFDAHSLSHLIRAPSAYFIFKFAIEDSLLQNRMMRFARRIHVPVQRESRAWG